MDSICYHPLSSFLCSSAAEPLNRPFTVVVLYGETVTMPQGRFFYDFVTLKVSIPSKLSPAVLS